VSCGAVDFVRKERRSIVVERELLVFGEGLRQVATNFGLSMPESAFESEVNDEVMFFQPLATSYRSFVHHFRDPVFVSGSLTAAKGLRVLADVLIDDVEIKLLSFQYKIRTCTCEVDVTWSQIKAYIREQHAQYSCLEFGHRKKNMN